ncbi:unnamed protein product [Prunus armeniaca]
MTELLSYPLGTKLLTKTPCQNEGERRWLLSLHAMMTCSMTTYCVTSGRMIQSHWRIFGKLVEIWRKLAGVNIQNLQVITPRGHLLMDVRMVLAAKYSHWTCWKNTTWGFHLVHKIIERQLP